LVKLNFNNTSTVIISDKRNAYFSSKRPNKNIRKVTLQGANLIYIDGHEKKAGGQVLRPAVRIKNMRPPQKNQSSRHPKRKGKGKSPLQKSFTRKKNPPNRQEPNLPCSHSTSRTTNREKDWGGAVFFGENEE